MKTLISVSSDGLVYLKRVCEERRINLEVDYNMKNDCKDKSGTLVGSICKLNLVSTNRLVYLDVKCENNYVILCMENEYPQIFGILDDGKFINDVPLIVFSHLNNSNSIEG
jgi:hypothetical protein